MAISNADRIKKALDLLRDGLAPYIAREMDAVHKDRWGHMARQALRDDRAAGGDPEKWDISAQVSVILGEWNRVFKYALGNAERSLVFEARDVRNTWAHQGQFSSDDAYRALDTIHRLLSAISAPQAKDLDRLRMDLLRQRFDEQQRHERRKVTATPIEGAPAAGFKPWREIVTPHPDVASGRYAQAEFAADLGQVHRGEGADEYKDPRQFYQRTYITEGLNRLLSTALRRLSGSGGDPVMELQTNFGGGKTHSMLALYHLFSGAKSADLTGIETVIEEADGAQPMEANRAVLVGTAFGPADPLTKEDGTVVRTLWGEMAWQLAGKEGYELVAEADEKGVSPGGDALRKVFTLAAPCLVLIDEWVAYLRNLYKVDGLPGGSFEANLTFAQALTESVKAVPRAMVVASIPASQIEIGGEGGEQALERITHTFGRLETAWRPASTEESFEIVRRRLFQPVDPSTAPARDAIVRAFAEQYRSQKQDFPAFASEAEYQRRMQASYPIHPELFDRLFNDWSTLERFQRTRGVLRLMAAVIHELWERDDRSLLILPAGVPIDAGPVQFELKQYLEDSWVPVIEKDVDGPNSLPLRIDRENPNLGRYSATRRVARTLFMASAPTHDAAHRGTDDRHLKLGSVQPGESTATFGDALRRLSESGTYLFADGNRYWFSTQQSVRQVARDLAAQYRDDDVYEELVRRLREAVRDRGDFARVHAVPSSSADVPDEREARLVVFGPDHPHASNADESPARVEARNVLDKRGSAPRIYKNTLVFLAPDRSRLEDLSNAIRQYLAWSEIWEERVRRNLDPQQANTAKTERDRAEQTVLARLPEAYNWLLVPGQSDAKSPIEWEEMRLQGSDTLVQRAAKRLRNVERLVTNLAGPVLRIELDRIPLWPDGRVSTQKLADYFATYLYLHRLRDDEVLLRAIEDGVSQFAADTDGFAYADAYDEERERYVGLRLGQGGNVAIDARSIIVKPAVARVQLEMEEEERRKREGGTVTTGGGEESGGGGEGTGTEGGGGAGGNGGGVGIEPRVLRRFHGAVELNSDRPVQSASQVIQEVVQHLTSLKGAKVEITLEVQAELPDGAPDQVVRTVTENCRTLKFSPFGFEEE